MGVLAPADLPSYHTGTTARTKGLIHPPSPSFQHHLHRERGRAHLSLNLYASRVTLGKSLLSRPQVLYNKEG